MDSSYSPEQIEKKWYQCWEQADAFVPKAGNKAYCIMLPPPNVTGSLHMGHAFQDTIMDTLIRYHRMMGHNTLWQGGTDHAGIATQMVVERLLTQENKNKHDLGRDAFVERVWQWKEQSGNTIYNQMRRLGTSVDWSRSRFTLDEGLSDAVTEVFVKLHDEGLIYRGKRLVNWDPKLHTALSDLEVLSTEEQGSLWHIKYPIDNSNEFVTIATTRPETLLGDVAVAIHPEDSRYQHLLGKHIRLPLCDRLIPIIADDYVDPEFGTGCVKITPAHDFNDYDMGKRHQLPLINIMDLNGYINDTAPKAYQGMERFDARKQIVKDLEAQGLLDQIEPHTLKIPRGDRSHVIVEPLLTDQWYVKTQPLAEPAIKAVENGDIQFTPDNWKNTYFEWMRNIEDWCISRQLWWGHRIPAWFDNEGNVYVAKTEADARKKYQLGDRILKQDEDVLDTWFSSALWPFSTLGWPDKTPELSTYYPTQVLVTGFDIIFFWVARMIMFGLKFTDTIPFEKVFVTGLIQDSEGQKMSKSKGNIIDPIDLIDGISCDDLVAKRTKGLMQPHMQKQIESKTRKQFPEGIKAHGTDALRFTLCAFATTGRHIRFDFSRLEGYKNFCNKIWNAARFVLSTCEDYTHQGDIALENLDPYNQWILGKTQQLIQECHQHIAEYRFDLLAQSLYEFTWDQYCDWFIEMAKPALYGSDETAKHQRQYTLLTVLEQLMRCMHPVMPFITEEIWQRLQPLLGQDAQTIMLSAYPAVAESQQPSVIDSLTAFQAVVQGIRSMRSELQLAPSKPAPVILRASGSVKTVFSAHEPMLQSLTKCDRITWIEPDINAPASASCVAGEIECFIPLAGLIDKDKELARIQKELAKVEKDINQSKGKLENEKFTNKAPAELVAREKDRLAASESVKEKLVQQQSMLEQL
jgi:valyl-tRNA synthetase